MTSLATTSDEEVCVAGEAQSTSDTNVNMKEIEDFLAKLKQVTEESSAKKNDERKDKA